MMKYDANLVSQQWFIFTKELPQPIWQGDSTPPPYGKIPVEHRKSLRGASLSALDISFLEQRKLGVGIGYHRGEDCTNTKCVSHSVKCKV